MRNVWSFASQPYSGAKDLADYVGADGKPYRVSKDCPEHGHLYEVGKLRTGECDGQQVDELKGIFDNANHLDRELESESFSILSRDEVQQDLANEQMPTPENRSVHKTSGQDMDKTQNLHHNASMNGTDVCNSDSGVLGCEDSATSRSNRNRKKVRAPGTNSAYISSSQNLFHTDDSEVLHETGGQTSHKDVNNISEDSFVDGKAKNLLAQTFLRNVGKCTCTVIVSDHFATFPEELPRRCILAATSERGACRQCGAPWERVVQVSGGTIGKSWVDHSLDIEEGMGQADGAEIRKGLDSYRRDTVGWRPTCACGGRTIGREACFSRRLERPWYRERWQEKLNRVWPEREGCLVLDPFAGSGTTGRVAIEMNRRVILNDLAYQELAEKRTAKVQRKLF